MSRHHTEPEILEFQKVHFKIRKMPFWPPKKMAPKSQLNGPKTPEKSILNAPKRHFFGPFNWLFGAIFLGGQNGIFRALKCTFWNSRILGSVLGRDNHKILVEIVVNFGGTLANFGETGFWYEPKGPFRTKNSTESKFRKKRYGNSKTLRMVLRSACFSREKWQENGTDSKTLRP